MNYGNTLLGARFDLATGTMTRVIRFDRDGFGVTAIPGSGCTMRVFQSTSSAVDIIADLADGTLSYANLIAGTQPTKSRWMLWASGPVTVDTYQSSFQNSGNTAIVATATGGTGVLEVAK